MTVRAGAVSIMVAALSQDLYHLVDLFSGKIAGFDLPISLSSAATAHSQENIRFVRDIQECRQIHDAPSYPAIWVILLLQNGLGWLILLGLSGLLGFDAQ